MKGISSILSVVIITLTVIVVGGSLFIYIGAINEDVQERASSETTSIIQVVSNCIKIVSLPENSVVIRNCGEGSITSDSLSVLIEGKIQEFTLDDPINPDELGTAEVIVSDGVETGDSQIILLNGKGQAASDIKVYNDICTGNNAFKKSFIGPMLYETRENEASSQWCFDFNSPSYYIDGFETYRTFSGRVLSTSDQSPYANGRLLFQFEGAEPSTITTDSEGNFEHNQPWGIDYIPENSIWKTVRKFDSAYSRQPPNKVRIDYRDNTTDVYETQQAIVSGSSSGVKRDYELIPMFVNDTHVGLKLNISLEVNNVPELDSDQTMVYYIPILSDGSSSRGSFYADIESISCEGDLECFRSTGTLRMEIVDGADQEYSSESLPSDENGKYIPLEYELEATGGDILAEPRSLIRYRNQELNSWSYPKSPSVLSYAKDGNLISYERRIYLEDIDNWLNSQGQDTAATSYLIQLTARENGHGWGRGPAIVNRNHYFSIDEDLNYNPSGSNVGGFDGIIWRGDVSNGNMYNLVLEYVIEKDSGRWFALTNELGNLAIVPEDGTTVDGIVNSFSSHSSYKRYRGSYFYQNSIIGQNADKHVQIPIPVAGDNSWVFGSKIPDGNEWTSTTYIASTTSNEVVRAYILDGRGESYRIGTSTVNAGDTLGESYTITPEDDEKVQLNWIFHSINWGDHESYYKYKQNIEAFNDGSRVKTWALLGHMNIQEDGYDLVGESTVCSSAYCLAYYYGAWFYHNALPGGFFETLDRVDISLEGVEGSFRHTYQDLWVWYLKEITADLKPATDNPDSVTISTLDGGQHDNIAYEEEFE